METETYRYTKTADGYTVARRSDGKVLGSIVRIEESYPKAASATGRRSGASRMGTAVFFEGSAPGAATHSVTTEKREKTARHLDALDRARSATYRAGDKISCVLPAGHWGSGVEIERIDGEHLYIVGHAAPISRTDIRISSTAFEALPVYAA